MKKNIIKHDNGITICDSIVMSVKRKKINLRRIEAVVIAVVGYISTIFAFLGMFDFKYSHRTAVFSAVIFSAVYILLSLAGKKAMWLVAVSVLAGGAVAYKMADTLILGYKYTYNIIYRTAMYKEIDYYKLLKPEPEESSVTALFVFVLWILAVVIYVFTIHHPNSLPPLLVTFPLIEIGLYNGIEISILWGMLLVAYWFAVFSMTATDMGEYSGGNGGFVRKENVFFPKRQMKLKVTEKCGIYIIFTVLAVTGITSFVLDMIVYERSEKINQKRIEIRDAVNSFSMDDLAGSISEVTSAFGFSFKVQSHKLGNVDRLKYKESTDLIVTFDDKYTGAVYLKEYTGSVYNNNQWQILPDSAYKDSIFADFKKYGTYPQDFPYRLNRSLNVIDSGKTEYTININSKLRKNKSFAPYGIDSLGIIEYEYDSNATSKSDNEYSYRFTKIDMDRIARQLDSGQTQTVNYELSQFYEQAFENQLTDYLNEKNLLDGDSFSVTSNVTMPLYDSGTVLAELIEKDYRDFVYENYLQIPDTADIKAVRDEFSGIFDRVLYMNSFSGCEMRLKLLEQLREKVSSMAEYSLNPGRTPATRDFVNYFLLENHKGYCTHYATAGVLLARMAGIPARYATGYVIVGDDFNDSTKNSDGSYTITVKDNRSHAWTEIYLDGYGWVPFEFTAGYTNQTIDTTPVTTTTTTTTESTETTTAESTDLDNTTTHRKRSTTVSSRTSAVDTDYETTVVTVTTVTEITETTQKTLPKAVKYIFCTLAVLILTALIVLLRRALILHVRRQHFNSGSHRSRMRYMYEYIEKILKYLKICQEDMQYSEFALYVEDSLATVYFSKNSFRRFMDTALKSAFSEYPPENDELAECLAFTESFAEELHQRADGINLFYLKFILVVI